MIDPELAETLSRIEALLQGAPRSASEAMAREQGLLSYEDLQDMLTVGRTTPHRPCMRTVKALVARNRGVVRPVKISHKVVGFRRASVERLLAHLAGEQPIGVTRL